MTYQAASGAGAQNMRELLQQMGEVHFAAKALLDDPGVRHPRHRPRSGGDPARRGFPDGALRRAARRQPPSLDRHGPRQRPEPRGVEGPRRDQQDPRPRRRRSEVPVDGLCVRVGAMRCHSQGLTIKLKRDLPLAEIEAILASGQPWVKVVPERARRNAEAPHAGGGDGHARHSRSGGCASCSMGGEYLSAFTVGDQLLWGAAEPLRRMLRHPSRPPGWPAAAAA